MPKSSTIAQPAKLQPEPGILSPEQSRAARGWLGWSQDELAGQANVALRSVAAFERGERMLRANNLAAMQRVIEAAGVRLLFDEHGRAAGVGRSDTTGALTASA
jgi:transcriptional regulator with XRE-family HTH domain